MKIYQLSQIGARIANNTNAPDTSNWRVIFALSKIGYATPDQIALQTGLEEGEVNNALVILKHRNIVIER
jgi:transcription initiation factor IIE alpha subunit